MMTHDLGFDLCLKRVRDGDAKHNLWLLFKSGELKQPIVILGDYSIDKLIEAVDKERQRRPTE